MKSFRAKFEIRTIVISLLVFFQLGLMAQAETSGEGSEDYPKLQNPFTTSYLKRNIKKSAPLLFIDNQFKRNISKQIKSSAHLASYYKTLQLEAFEILKEPLSGRELVGRRMLGVSRSMVRKMGILSMVYIVDGEPAVLKRIDDEVKAVCSFVDWNPSHFLDVAEMAFAVSVAVDWVGDELPSETVELAKKALLEKGIKESFELEKAGWISGNDNWTQVCHAGMMAAAIVTAKENPEWSAKVISRALDNLPNVMKEYGPDGIYPEGPTYWHYGTVYNVIASEILQSAFGQDFGIAAYPSFLESADFIRLSTGPSGYYFNFSDCGERKSFQIPILQTWFSARTNNADYFERDFFELAPEIRVGASRFSGPGLVWLSRMEVDNLRTIELPTVWSGGGPNPLAFFRKDWTDPNGFYLGMKGGSAIVNHGNMDAGTFVFELNGVRWVVDPGNQNYYDLEKEGFDLWDICQECERWTLLTKHNRGHSTLTVDGKRHAVDGYAPIIEFVDGEKPSVSFDLSGVFPGQLEMAHRTFKKEGNDSFTLRDELIVSDNTMEVTWAIMTLADVLFTNNGVVLEQDGQQLELTIINRGDLNFSMVQLDPPPLKLDKLIPGLKRLEIKIPTYLLNDNRGEIVVRFSGK